MASRKPRYFLLTYFDDDAKTFNVIGPVTDDEAVIERTVSLRKMGRHLRVSTSKPITDPGKLPSIQKYIRKGPEGFRHAPGLWW